MDRLPEAPDVRRLLYHVGLDLSMTVLTKRLKMSSGVGALRDAPLRLDGIRRGKHSIILGLESKLIFKLQGLSSSFADWCMDRLVAKAQARKPEARG